MSGHGGNCSFLVNVVKYAGERHRRIFAATPGCTAGHRPYRLPSRRTALRHRRHGPRRELETAMLLHLRPETVHMARCR